jgi:hyperosmotically inducible protein
MNRKLAIGLLTIGAMLGPAVVLAAGDSDADRSHPKAFVKDSAITTKIKARLAAEHITSLGRIHVDTDKDGVVWLSGHARSHEASEKAESIARETEGVKEVRNHIRIKKDD